MHHTVIETFLSEELGLSQNERQIYICLLQLGPATVLEISEYTGINRATVHMNVDYLTKKSLISQIKKGKGSRRIIIAEPPEKLGMILQQQQNRLKIAQQQLPVILKTFSSFSAAREDQTSIDIRYYKGKNEVTFIYELAIKAAEFRSYVKSEKLSNIFPNNPQKFIEEYLSRKNMHIWEILEDCPASQKYLEPLIVNSNYQYKLFPKNTKIVIPNIDYMLFDGIIAMVDFDQQINGITIQNKNLYQHAKSIFEFIWQTLTPDT